MNKLIGDEKNGLELRYQTDAAGMEFLDEIVLTVDGKVVCHAEKMNDGDVLFIFDIAGYRVHADIHIGDDRDALVETVQIDP